MKTKRLRKTWWNSKILVCKNDIINILGIFKVVIIIHIILVPHSQIKSLYGGMEIDDTKKPPKDKKKEGEKKSKKQQDKKAEPPKPRPPKTIEGALEAVSHKNLIFVEWLLLCSLFFSF